MEKIMVVDDEAIITTHLEEQLTFMGYEVVGRASSGELATDMAKRLRPDLILMDIVMPGKLDGIDASEIIKKELNIPIIFLTAYEDDKFIKRAKITEPYGYIIKPALESELKASVELALYKKDVEKRRREPEENWHSLVENIGEGIIVCDTSGKVFFWNNMAQTIFGYSADEAIGKPLAFIMCKGTREAFKKGRIQVISTGNPVIIGDRIDIFCLRKDGSQFPVEFLLTAGNVKVGLSFTCIVRDITERKMMMNRIKASLREKEVILGESHYRTRDNLLLIYSLLDLQSKYIKDKQALVVFKESSDRIRSIALIYEKLYQLKDPMGIDFAYYIRNLVARLFHSYGTNTNLIKQKVNVDNVFLDIKTAVTCGLIISELVSNSLKYAFPDEKKGEIGIDFHLDKEKQLRVLVRSNYTLVVRDNGVGFPKDLDICTTESMGLQLVNDFVHQLNGSIQLKRRGGTTFKISFERLKNKKQY